MFLITFVVEKRKIVMSDIEIWWTSLPIAEKERIARKAQQKNGKTDESLIQYPGCTRWWNALDDVHKLKIHDHCVAHHGDELKEWDNANPYGD